MTMRRPIDILGITSVGGGFHDSSVAWIRDGVVMLALSEERLSRIKHDYSFPKLALEEVLRASGVRPEEFAGVAVGWMDYNAFSGFFSRSIWDVPATVARTVAAKPSATFAYAAHNFLGKKMLKGASKLGEFGFSPGQVHHFSHHLSHAASSFRTSGFKEALSVNLDCFGPDNQGRLWAGAVYTCRESTIELVEYVPPYASLGLFYSAISVCLGFKFGDGEGKTMGLAAYGDSTRAYDRLKVICPRFERGEWEGHASWSDFRLIDNPELLFSTKWGRYVRETINTTSREDVAAAAQLLLEEQLMAFVENHLTRTGMRKVVLAGGTFLNVTFNRKLAENAGVDEVYTHPFPSDGGTAVGAALELAARLGPQSVNYALPSAALGCEYSDPQIREAIEQASDRVTFERPTDLPLEVAKRIADGAIVGWFQGREEWGPRALGYRSVLGDPRKKGTKERLNTFLKSRDWFMPFAPSILEEHGPDYFENSFYTPFMTFSFKVRPERVAEVPEIVHHDGSARPNMVREAVNPRYYRLIRAFQSITGVPIVLNTSFNRHGLPLVHTPAEAIDHLLWGCFDVLAIGDYLVSRRAGLEPVDEFSQQALLNAYTEEAAAKNARKT